MMYLKNSFFALLVILMTSCNNEPTSIFLNGTSWVYETAMSEGNDTTYCYHVWSFYNDTMAKEVEYRTQNRIKIPEGGDPRQLGGIYYGTQVTIRSFINFPKITINQTIYYVDAGVTECENAKDRLNGYITNKNTLMILQNISNEYVYVYIL